MDRLTPLRSLLDDFPAGSDEAEAAARHRNASLTKPAGALGRLEDIAIWAARWQGRHPPRAEACQVVVFAGNHGVAAQGVSAYPAEVTGQMVANFAAGGAAINQLAAAFGARFGVVPLDLDRPTADFTRASAMTEEEFRAAVRAGYEAVKADNDLLLVGEMGIGNTTAAAAVACALFGGGGADWAGPGTGLDEPGVARKARVIDAAVAHHGAALADPLETLRLVGGRELAAIAGAVAAARHHRIPVILDGFVTAAAAAPLYKVSPTALDHCLSGHVSAEPGHARLLDALGQRPLLSLGMRLGEASGAAVALGVVKAAVAAHTGMASFDEAGVSERDG